MWYIRKGALIQDVAKMLGDTVAMVERHYLPYIEELKDAHVATNKRILEAAGAAALWISPGGSTWLLMPLPCAPAPGDC